MKKKIFTIFILIFFVSLLSGLFSTQSLYTGEIFRNDDVLPKSNADEIVIHTPENRSYTSPMNGYYPATYGFENDDVGTNPAEWEVFEGAGYVDVIDEINNHQRVVELYDNDNTNHDELHISFSLQTYGTVEFWVMSNDVSDTFSIRLLDDTATSVWGDGIGWIQLYLDFVRYQDNTSTYYNVKPVSDNTWYHIKIEFECSTGNYQGLAQDTWRFYVDGEEFGDFGFLNDIENVSQLYFFTRGSDMDYRYYVDAVGFSWDEHYQIGDNLNEGLLLSFDTNFTPDWMGYSLDGAPNRTILGNVTFPMPADGQYKIQVFGNDTLGTMYVSNLRHFTIDTLPPVISIISPTSGQYFSNPPSFILSITEANLVSSWYTLNGGPSIPFTGTSGTIDSTAWNSLSDGNVAIRFYVRDSGDQEDFDEVTITKSSVEVPQEIPGYNLLILIGISVGLIGIIVKKRLKF